MDYKIIDVKEDILEETEKAADRIVNFIFGKFEAK